MGVGGLVAILVFILSLILLIAAAASGYESIDLLPTSTGLLYALAGAVAACAAVVTLAIGVLTWRIGALTKLVAAIGGASRHSSGLRGDDLSRDRAAPKTSPAPSIEAARESGDEAPGTEDESPININRSGHLPSLEAIDTVLETPEEPQGPPSLIGSYSSAGANYKIFSDGSIEAETSEGTFQFASMSDFKRHLMERGRAKAEPTNE